MPNTPMHVRIAQPERRRLANVLNSLLAWDEATVVRVLTAGKAVGIYAETPTKALAFVALPLAAPPEGAVDQAISAHRWRDVLGDVSDTAIDSGDDLVIPDPRDMPDALATMPARSGWVSLERATGRAVSNAIKPLMAQCDGSSLMTWTDAWWDSPSWGGLPFKALHAASELGLLDNPAVMITAGTHAGWQRLASPAGQVFVAPGSVHRGISLDVLG